MCMGGKPKDNSAQVAREQEEKRLARVREGTNRINQIFGGPVTTYGPTPKAPIKNMGKMQVPVKDYDMTPPALETVDAPGQFTDDYYSNLGKSYLDYYTPELDRQYQDAQKQTTFRFANSGNLDSGSSNTAFGDLAQQYAMQRTQLADRSLAEQQGARSNVEQTRADLIAQLEGGAGVESTAQSAMARASALSQGPQYSPLGDMFSQITGALANSSAMQSKGYQGLPFMKRDNGPAAVTGGSSVRTVQ